MEQHENEIRKAFAGRVTVHLPFVVSPQKFTSLVDMEAIARRQAQLRGQPLFQNSEDSAARELRDQVKKMEEELEKLREAVASGQAEKASEQHSNQHAVLAVTRGQALINSIADKDAVEAKERAIATFSV